MFAYVLERFMQSRGISKMEVGQIGQAKRGLIEERERERGRRRTEEELRTDRML